MATRAQSLTARLHFYPSQPTLQPQKQATAATTATTTVRGYRQLRCQRLSRPLTLPRRSTLCGQRSSLTAAIRSRQTRRPSPPHLQRQFRLPLGQCPCRKCARGRPVAPSTNARRRCPNRAATSRPRLITAPTSWPLQDPARHRLPPDHPHPQTTPVLLMQVLMRMRMLLLVVLMQVRMLLAVLSGKGHRRRCAVQRLWPTRRLRASWPTS